MVRELGRVSAAVAEVAEEIAGLRREMRLDTRAQKVRAKAV